MRLLVFCSLGHITITYSIGCLSLVFAWHTNYKNCASYCKLCIGQFATKTIISLFFNKKMVFVLIRGASPGSNEHQVCCYLFIYFFFLINTVDSRYVDLAYLE